MPALRCRAQFERRTYVAKRVEPLLSRVQRLTRTRVYRALLYRLSPDLVAGVGNQPVPAKEFANLTAPAEVVAYFPDPPARAYQIEQWLPVFEQLHVHRPMLVVLRNLGTFRHLRESTRLPLVYVRQLRDLENLLVGADPKVCLYVNNASGNFPALGWRRALHVHLNHGESDKISMASNQAKAYDFVFVAGEAAEARYKESLLSFDGSSLVRVGRPQLDLEFPSTLQSAARTTVMYAPTWEGETEAMNYTSLPRYGPPLVRALLADGALRVVYRPHPLLLSGSKPAVAAHETIVRELAAANGGMSTSDRHVVDLDSPILALFPPCDVLVTDVSSVALDWLYLRTDAPLWICDPRDDREALVRASPLAGRTYVLDGGIMGDVAARVRESLEADPRRSEREEARRAYFGDLAPGESTQRFLQAIDRLVARRDDLLEEKRNVPGLDLEAVGVV
jgi:CDP-Glycerol:Poly(glycerophosphate) glycerophosphotransferase